MWIQVRLYVGSIVGPPVRVRQSIRPIDRSIELAGGRCRSNLAQSAAGKEGGRRHQFSHLDRLIISYPGECVRGRGERGEGGGLIESFVPSTMKRYLWST